MGGNEEADLIGLCPVDEGAQDKKTLKDPGKNMVNMGVQKHIKTSFMPLLLTGPSFFNVSDI